MLIVLESVGARWTSLNGGLYDTTPNLLSEARHGVVVDNFYSHIGRSSNALAAMLLSTYPKLDFQDITDEYPNLPGTSLAEAFRAHGARTAFVTSSSLTWGHWGDFLARRGFDELRDYHNLSCSEPPSEWGVEDRCLADGIIQFIGQNRERPFFVMGWTTQTHYPYEPTASVPHLELLREPGPDQWELDRYLNALHETDRQLGRLFSAIREAGLESDTLTVIVGDHGQAFGYPHNSYAQGQTAYEEDVRVPLLIHFPRAYRDGVRSKVLGGQVDLAPAITELAGLPAGEWQGRSLCHPTSSACVFSVGEDRFILGVRRTTEYCSISGKAPMALRSRSGPGRTTQSGERGIGSVRAFAATPRPGWSQSQAIPSVVAIHFEVSSRSRPAPARSVLVVNSAERGDAMRFSLVNAAVALAFPTVVFLLFGSVQANKSGRQEALARNVPANMKPLNMRWGGYRPEDVDAFRTVLGLDGRIAERRFLEYDLTFPTFYGGALIASLLWTSTALLGGGLPWLVISPVIVGMLADWTENLVQLEQLHRYVPGQASSLDANAIHVASLATVVKLVSLSIASITLLVIVGALLTRSRT